VKKATRPGLPDFSWHKIPKWWKITSILPNGHKIYQMAIIYYKWELNTPTYPILRPSKIYPNWDFWFENTYTIWQPWTRRLLQTFVKMFSDTKIWHDVNSLAHKTIDTAGTKWNEEQNMLDPSRGRCYDYNFRRLSSFLGDFRLFSAIFDTFWRFSTMFSEKIGVFLKN
jgi:hypothetical protein